MSEAIPLHPFLRWLGVLSAVGIALLFGLLNSTQGELPTQGAFRVLVTSFTLSLFLMALPLLPGILGGQGCLRRWFSLPRGEGGVLLRWVRWLTVVALGCSALVEVMAPAKEQATVRLLAGLTPSQLAVMAFFLCVLTPVVEEGLFRGILLEAARPAVALPVSTALFAFAHGGNGFVLPLFFMGWCLGLLALRTRSLLPCVFLHGAFNLISLLLSAMPS